MARHKFEPNNTYGKGRPAGTKNKINREEVIQLCNMVVKDFITRYDELTVYQRMKLLSILQNVLRDAMVDQVEVTEPRVFDIVIHHGENEYKELKQN